MSLIQSGSNCYLGRQAWCRFSRRHEVNQVALSVPYRRLAPVRRNRLSDARLYLSAPSLLGDLAPFGLATG